MTDAVTSNAKGALIDNLNGLLANHFALFMKTKNFHWHVRGPHFRDLHLLFDEQAQAIISVTDAIAERVRKNGGATLTSVGAVAARSQIADQDDSALEAMAMVKELRQDNETLIAQLRKTKESAEQAGDNATDGLIDDWTDQAEERAWFLASVAA